MKFLIIFIITLFLLQLTTDNIFAKKSLHINACADKGNNWRCHSHIETDESFNPKVKNLPEGFGPKQFLEAYNLKGRVKTNTTVAIVDAFDNPNIFNDINHYSKTFNIPLMNECPINKGSILHPCFQKVNQKGGSNPPSIDSGWASETALDGEIIHGLCQNCNILLVEANSDSFNDLITAFDRATSMGADVISNSYGGREFSEEKSFDSHFNHPGIAITFSSGDSGYGPEYPAASKFVTAVGGTTLKINSNNTYLSEKAWDGAGSGCSKYESKPSWQNDKKCSNRTIADVSADADPNTGAAIYNSLSFKGQKGWFKVGGTSLASPIIATVYAQAGNIKSNIAGNSIPYKSNARLHDVIDGNNGNCKTSYLCRAIKGYDGPTGLGSPNGLSGF